MMNDFRDRVAAVETRQWVGALLSLTAVLVIAALFFAEWLYGYWKPEPELYYFESWEATRSYEDALRVQEEEVRLSEEADAIADQLAAEALEGFDAAAPAQPNARADSPAE